MEIIELAMVGLIGIACLILLGIDHVLEKRIKKLEELVAKNV